MMTRLARTTLAMALLLTPLACGGGLSAEDANAECERLAQDLETCLTDDDAFAACVSCHEECGVSCDIDSACSFGCD